MVRVLHYIYGLNIGGAESFLYNLISSIPKDEFVFDFCIQSKKNINERLIKLIECRGGKIHHIAPYNKRYIKNRNDFKKIVISGNYKIIHFHMNSLINVEPIKEGLKLGIQVVVHSHSTKTNAGKIGNIIHKINVNFFENKKFQRLSCGYEAGKWFYKKSNFIIIQNGINVNDYKFSEERRTIIRNSLGITDNIRVIGHVGRFTYAKNHEFILDVFNEVCKITKNIRLVLVGDGELRTEVEKKVLLLGLKEKVNIIGNVSNVSDYLSAFDLLLFPSHYEGLPFVMIEAQTSGLPILCSDVISQDACITDLTICKSLNEDKKDWATNILNISMEKQNRPKYANIIEKTNYNSVMTARKVINLYYELIGDKQ